MSAQENPNRGWCHRCGCEQHPDGERCSGDLLATGPERYGCRLLADVSGKPLVFGTLVAPAGERWRARLMTFPNILWVVPRGKTMKFTASTAARAEEKALDFLKEHCRRRGFKIRKETPSVVSGELDHEQERRVAESNEVRASQRQLRPVRVRYRRGDALLEAETDDLSEGGLFIRTRMPAKVGTVVELRLDMGGFGISQRGVVRWARGEEEEGRPAGMGLELINPHPRYIHFLRQMKPAAPEKADGATYEAEERVPAG